MSDLPAKTSRGDFDRRHPDDLVIEAVDEQALHEARERSAARMRLLWNNHRFLVRVAICGLVLATLIAFLIPKRYQSTARLMPPEQAQSGAATMLAALAGRAGSGLTSLAESALGMKTTGNLFIGILESETVQDDLIRRFDLQKLYGNRYVEDTRRALVQHTDISEDQKSGIITVSVTDHDPRRAAAMAQEYVNELNWVVTNLSTSSARRERIFLDQRLQQVKVDLEAAEKQFSQFASKKGAIDIPSQGKAMVEAAAALQGQMIAAQSELEAYRQIYTDKNVRVQALQARVEELRRSLQKIGGTGADETSSADQLYPSIRQLPLLGVAYADLLRRTKVEEAVFETLTQEDELAKVEEAKEIPTVKVLDPPLVPDKKSFPPRLLIMGVGTMLAIVVGASWVLGNAAWEATASGDPHKALAIEVWSSVRSNLPWTSRNGAGAGLNHEQKEEMGRAEKNQSGEAR